MGNLLSKARILLNATADLQRTYNVLVARIGASPGLPVPNPTRPLWIDPPAAFPESDTAPLPRNADIIIIGSGITGTSVAYRALSSDRDPTVLMLEARDVCSGATGRCAHHACLPVRPTDLPVGSR